MGDGREVVDAFYAEQRGVWGRWGGRGGRYLAGQFEAPLLVFGERWVLVKGTLNIPQLPFALERGIRSPLLFIPVILPNFVLFSELSLPSEVS